MLAIAIGSATHMLELASFALFALAQVIVETNRLILGSPAMATLKLLGYGIASGLGLLLVATFIAIARMLALVSLAFAFALALLRCR